MNLPESIRSINTLINRLPPEHKNPVMESVVKCKNMSSDWIRSLHRHSGEHPQVFRPQVWHRLYYHHLGAHDFLILQYDPDAIWAFRGPVEVSGDMFGPSTVTIHDRLRMAYPIFSRFSLDTRKR